MRVIRATLLLGVSLAYFGHVSHLCSRAFWTAGLGDWIDPYFINYLLEHWRYSVLHLSDPSSPLMYFPARHTLGYSHGLILYAPFYLTARTLLHPFIAYNVTLLLVMEAGVVCLYVLLRKFANLSVLEVLVLCAFFATSENVINEMTGIWSQRASLFLIPPLVLLALESRRRLALAPLAGFLAALMLTQDFVTALLALLVVGMVLAPRIAMTIVPFWRRSDRVARVAIVIALIAALWGLFGGIDTHLFGVRIVSTRADRPLLLAALLLAFAAWRTGLDAWTKRFGIGAAAGVLLFLWIYLPAYRAYHSFAGSAGHGAYPTARPFELVAAVALLVCIPRFRGNRAFLWFALVSLAIFALPHVPLTLGFIRDPIRIIYPFELAVVLVLAWLMTSASRELRIAITALAVVLIAVQWNRETFAFERPVAAYQRWVDAPIAVDRQCRAFFVLGASDAYMARSPHRWSLYNIDAMFIALQRSLPTLNGYSAWGPVGWELQNPQKRATYLAAVDNWIRRNALMNVCALDIDQRTMRPYTPSEAGDAPVLRLDRLPRTARQHRIGRHGQHERLDLDDRRAMRIARGIDERAVAEIPPPAAAHLHRCAKGHPQVAGVAPFAVATELDLPIADGCLAQRPLAEHFQTPASFQLLRERLRFARRAGDGGEDDEQNQLAHGSR